MKSWEKEGDDGELTFAGLGLSAECWAVDPAALQKEKKDITRAPKSPLEHSRINDIFTHMLVCFQNSIYCVFGN